MWHRKAAGKRPNTNWEICELDTNWHTTPGCEKNKQVQLQSQQTHMQLRKRKRKSLGNGRGQSLNSEYELEDLRHLVEMSKHCASIAPDPVMSSQLEVKDHLKQAKMQHPALKDEGKLSSFAKVTRKGRETPEQQWHGPEIKKQIRRFRFEEEEENVEPLQRTKSLEDVRQLFKVNKKQISLTSSRPSSFSATRSSKLPSAKRETFQEPAEKKVLAKTTTDQLSRPTHICMDQKGVSCKIFISAPDKANQLELTIELKTGGSSHAEDKATTTNEYPEKSDCFASFVV